MPIHLSSNYILSFCKSKVYIWWDCSWFQKVILWVCLMDCSFHGSIGVLSSSNVRGMFHQMYKKLSNETVSWSAPLTQIICGPHMCVMSTKCVRGHSIYKMVSWVFFVNSKYTWCIIVHNYLCIEFSNIYIYISVCARSLIW